MRARSATELLALPVRHRDIELGRPVDVLIDVGARRALGLDVRCRDEVHRFLPLGAARIHRAAVVVASPLILLDDLAFYRARASSLRSLRGAAIRRGGRPLGVLDDVLVGEGGAIEGLRVETTTGLAHVELTADVDLGAERSASAA